jgi:hypothetical protein
MRAHELTLGADVEVPGAEGESHGKPREEDGHDLDDEFAEETRVEAPAREVDPRDAHEEGPVHVEGVPARAEEDDGTEEEAPRHG